ncbi:citrate:proton symporter [Staphylococcus arlettae]|uniref:CitMHS family transporter n=1 Tax=Staphylococcus arlettae TaxID=29378 RepID=UPI001F2B059C|nr:citrate:proton symporter [Staphylococcus arlettae]MCE4985178.1 citrate:proton symporter [Staphylococcus arlettae]
MEESSTLLTIVGLLIIISIVTLLIIKKISPVVGMILIPIVGALLIGHGFGDIRKYVDSGIDQVFNVAIMFIFAIIYFGIISDSGLFRPFVKVMIKFTRGNVIIVAVVTALIGTCAQLDGAGATTFLLAIPALLPLYRALKMSPYLLVLLLALSAAIINMVPWGGPMARTASVIGVDNINDLWYQVIPLQLIGIVLVVLFAMFLGMREKRKIARTYSDMDREKIDIQSIVEGYEQQQNENSPIIGEATKHKYILWLNLILTIIIVAMMLLDIVPPELAFMIGVAIALPLNFRNVDYQMERIRAHAPNALMMAAVILAAGVFLGILNETGMLKAIALSLITILPTAVGPYLHIIVGMLGVPLDLLTSTDAYYFAILPIVESTAGQFNVPTESTAFALMIGNVIGTFVSPFAPAVWLAVGLAEINMGKYIKYAFFWVWGFSIIMLIIAICLGIVTI